MNFESSKQEILNKVLLLNIGLVAGLFFLIFFDCIYSWYKQDQDVSFIYKDLSTFAVGVMSIAITTWVSLNIFNALEKNEIDKLTKSTGELGDSLEELNEKAGKYELGINIKLSEIEFENTMHKRNLLEVELDSDPIWGQLFLDTIDALEFEAQDIAIAKVIEGELYFKRIKNAYSSKNWALVKKLTNYKPDILREEFDSQSDYQDLNIYRVLRDSEVELYHSIACREEEQWESFKYFSESNVANLINNEDFLLESFKSRSDEKQLKGYLYQKIAHIYIYLLGHQSNREYQKDEKNWIEQANKFAEKSISLDLSTSEIYRIIGMIYERILDPEIALDYFEKSLEIDPLCDKAAYKKRCLELKLISDRILEISDDGKNWNIIEQVLSNNETRKEILKKLNNIHLGIQSDLQHYNQSLDFYNLLTWCYICLAIVDDSIERQKIYLEKADIESKYGKRVNTFNADINAKKLKVAREYIESIGDS